MKKALIVIFTLMYLLSTAGIGINIHHCGNKKSTVLLSTGGNHLCKCGKKKMAKNCCKDEQRFLKLTDSHKNSNSNTISLDNFAAIYVCNYLCISNSITSSKVKITPVSNSPPLLSKRLYLQNRVLLI